MNKAIVIHACSLGVHWYEIYMLIAPCYIPRLKD